MKYLELALRGSYVQRWTIVNVDRPQSVNEHQYNTWLIAEAIWGRLFPIEHNSDDHSALMHLALTHDLHEVLLGDLPSTAKEFFTIRELADAQTVARQAMGLASMGGNEGTVQWYVVKMADTLDALLYTFMHLRPGNPEVPRHIGSTCNALMAAAISRYSKLPWDHVHDVMGDMCADPAWHGFCVDADVYRPAAPRPMAPRPAPGPGVAADGWGVATAIPMSSREPVVPAPQGSGRYSPPQGAVPPWAADDEGGSP